MAQFVDQENLNNTKLGDTQFFQQVEPEAENGVKLILDTVYHALTEKGYNPVNQIVGYIISEDPTYITNYNNSRAIISKIDRDELLRALVEDFINIDGKKKG
ncbi:MAG: IreB family regulatory phosphoprotein [Clostridia bacterium]|nr:IreB family regulatory phosphoprotein [Clostridia bacterium]